MADPEREDSPAKWQQSGEKFPSGNICDTLGGINGTYSLQGISAPYNVQGMSDNPTAYRSSGIALLERAGHAARELGPFSDKLDGFLGQVGLIAIKMMKQPLPDCSDDLAMLARMVRE
ncbi:MAG: hypothetical protein WCL10_18815 [Novosphingobium sp.]|uniref:hypothetical protein n=1 Tax=Novosphingobium sp. TaxID=1874826 RepID=UPI003018BCB1